MTTLDPRALEAATEAVGRHIHYSRLSHNCHRCRRTAESAITAYLAVTQPVVETVEELVELPGRSAVVDADGMVAQMDAHDPHHWDGLERCWDATQITLPARVIWRPQP